MLQIKKERLRYLLSLETIAETSERSFHLYYVLQNLEFGSSEGMQWSECDAEEEDTPEAPKQGGTYPPDVFPAAANSSMLLQQNIPGEK